MFISLCQNQTLLLRGLQAYRVGLIQGYPYARKEMERIDGQGDARQREREKTFFVWLKVMNAFIAIHNRATMYKWH